MSLDEQAPRTTRYPFSAPAEIIVEDSGAKQLCRVKELSLFGCYLDTPVPLHPKTPILLNIYGVHDYFEAPANVIYAHPTLGMGIGFRSVKPASTQVLQKWLLQAMQDSSKEKND